MGEWMKRNPVLSALINLMFGIIIVLAVAKVYIDYKFNEELGKFKQQLNTIESSTDTILEILKGE